MYCFFFLMIRRPPRSTRTDTRFPDTTLFRSGGGPLETLGSLKALALDKTGTLTEGRPRITDIVPATGVNDGELMAIAVAVERLSDHPLAVAIARDGEQFLDGQPVLAATDLSSPTGRGVQARVNRSEERRGGKRCASTCKSRWSSHHSKKQLDKKCKYTTVIV